MAGSIVSLRIPKSLLEEFKSVSEKDHFLDLSDAVRSVIRKKWLEISDPYSYHVKKLRKEIKEAVDHKKDDKKQQMLLHELEKIKELIREAD